MIVVPQAHALGLVVAAAFHTEGYGRHWAARCTLTREMISIGLIGHAEVAQCSRARKRRGYPYWAWIPC